MTSSQPPVDLLFVTLFFYPVYAGPAVRFHRYEPGLRSRDIHMSVFCGTASTEEQPAQPPPPIGTLLALEDVGGIPVQRVQLPSGTNISPKQAVFSQNLIPYLKQRAKLPDVMQFVTAPQRSIPMLLRLRRMGVPMIYTSTLLGEMSSNPLKRLIQPLYWRIPLQLMDCVVVSSSVMKTALQKELYVTTRIEIIPNGLNLERFHPVKAPDARRALREKLGLNPTADLIVFVGPLNHRKGVDVLAEAWTKIARQYPNAHLILVGPSGADAMHGRSTPEFQQRFEDALAASGAADRVVMTGLVSNVEAYLQAADIFVFPSRREGMPNVVPEAFGCGAPTILTPFVGLPQEFGRPGQHYELVERTADALAGALSALLDNPQRRQQLSQKARQLVEEEMDVNVSINRYADLYREYAARNPAKR